MAFKNPSERRKPVSTVITMKHASTSQFECENNENPSLINTELPIKATAHTTLSSDDSIRLQMTSMHVCMQLLYVCVGIYYMCRYYGLSKHVCFYRKKICKVGTKIHKFGYIKGLPIRDSKVNVTPSSGITGKSQLSSDVQYYYHC